MADTRVTNNVESNQFEIHTEDGRLAGFSQYKDSDGVREFVHTVVEDEFEGKGIGRKLARTALDRTRADGLKVVATCKFIKRWIGRNPEYEDLLV